MANPPVLEHVGRYDLSASEVERLTAELATAHDAQLAKAKDDGHEHVIIAVDGRLPAADIGRDMEQTVFDADLGDHSLEMMRDEYGGYEDRSIFLLAYYIDSGTIVGSARLITGTAGFGPMVKTTRDVVHLARNGRYETDVIDLRDQPDELGIELGLVGRDPSKSSGLSRLEIERHHKMKPGDGILDVACIVIPPEHRGRQQIHVSAALFAGMWRVATALNMVHWVAMMQVSVFGMLVAGLGLDFRPLCGLDPIEYVEGDPELSQAGYLLSTDVLRTIEQNRSASRGTFRGGFTAMQDASDFDSMYVLFD